MKNFCAHFSNFQHKKQKNNIGSRVQVVADRWKSPREQLCIVCMKNFCVHFSNLNPKKQKKIMPRHHWFYLGHPLQTAP
jgi:hypothetical protein